MQILVKTQNTKCHAKPGFQYFTSWIILNAYEPVDDQHVKYIKARV